MKVKKILSSVLAALMAITATIMPVSAEEENVSETAVIFDESNIVDVEYGEDGEEIITYEFEVPGDSSIGGGDADINSAGYSETTYMVTESESTHRTYYYNKLRFSVTVTDAYGNACNNGIMVQMYKDDIGVPLINAPIEADGFTTTLSNIAIVHGGTYYFHYLIRSGTPRTLKVVLRTTAYNSYTS